MAARKKKRTKNINLLPQKEFESSMYGRILNWLLTSFRYIVIVVELIVIIGFLARFFFDVQNTDLGDDITTNQGAILGFSEFEKEFRRTQDKLEIYAAYSDPELYSTIVFDQVVASIPADTRMTKIRVNLDGVEIEGESQSEISISQFISNLRSQELFENVILTRTEASEDSTFIDFAVVILHATI